MSESVRQFDFWYAVNHTEVIAPPRHALETFGATRVNYHLVAELEDDPRRIRIREGRLEAHRPALIMPESLAQDSLEGFGEEARRYFEFLKEHEDSVHLLRYGYCLKQEAYTEQIVTDSMSAVLDRVCAEAKAKDDPFAVVLKGVDDPWDVCLVKFFWMHVANSIGQNVRELEAAKVRRAAAEASREPPEIAEAFARAERNPALVKDLGRFLKAKGVFDRYQDRFFKLLTRG